MKKNNNNHSQILGEKFQIYIDDELRIRRIIKIKNEECFVLKDTKSGETIIISKNDLYDKYVKLTPDAFLNIMITKEESYSNIEDNDVYFCVNRSCDLVHGSTIPSLLLRQNIYSRFKNQFATNNDIYVGDCLTIVNSEKNDIKESMTFKEIKKSYSIAMYIDDTVDDIIECISSKFKKEINTLLKKLKDNAMFNIKGFNDNIESLLEENDFIGNYYSLFNITKIDFPIILGKESYNDEGDIILNDKQHKAIEDLLRKYITNIKVIKYDKDIDISKIVSIDHVMVCDSNNEIFLIAYESTGYYINEDNMDVAKSMGIV